MKLTLNLTLIMLSALIMIACGGDDPSPKNAEKKIISFKFLADDNPSLSEDVVASINETVNVISAIVPPEAELSDLVPAIEVSSGAVISPEGPQDFSDLMSYVVTAEDGSELVYVIRVKLAPNGANEIISFQFLLSENPIEVNAIGEVDPINKSILVVLPGNALQTALIPSISVSNGASVSPDGAQNFAKTVDYTVTAADGTSTVYKVTTVTEMDALKAIYYANPMNSLGWNTGDSDLSNWDGVTLKNGAMVDLLIHNAGLTIIPPEIGYFKNLQSLRMHMNNFSILPPEIGKLLGLKRLSVGLNFNLSSVPPEIGQLLTLETFFLDNNPSLTSLPEEIGQLINLKALYINGNNLSNIPEEICDLETVYGTMIYKEAALACE